MIVTATTMIRVEILDRKISTFLPVCVYIVGDDNNNNNIMT